MLLSLGTLDVFALPKGLSSHILSRTREDSRNLELSGLENERIIKVCTTLCNRYLLVLTKRTLYAYSNGQNVIFLGSFTLDAWKFKEYGGFRDITILNGIYQICLLVENLKKVLICRYDTNAPAGYDFTVSHMNTPRHSYPNVSSENVFNNSYANPVSPKTAPQQTSGSSDKVHASNNGEISHVSHLFSGYLPNFLNITLSFELILPSFISVVSCIDYQLFFWTFDQSGVYATMCSDGFLNYILKYPLYQFKRIPLHLQSTNVLQSLKVHGSVDSSHGLCFLNLTSQLYLMDRNEIDDISELNVDIYASEDKDCNRPVSLMNWVSSCASKVIKEPNADEDMHSCSDESNDLESMALNADSIISSLEERNMDSFYDDSDNCIQNILPSINAKQVEFMETCDVCYVVTTSNSLLSFSVCNKLSTSGRIGTLWYRYDVESISVNIHRNFIAVKLISGGVVVYHSSEEKRTLIGHVKADDINDYCWFDDHLVILCKNDEISSYHFTGRMVYNHKLYKPIKNGNLYAISANFRLMITEESSFLTYTLYNSGICHSKFTDPNTFHTCLVGAEGIILVHSNFLDGCCGSFERRGIDDSLYSKSGYTDYNTMGNIGRSLVEIPFSCNDELFSNKTPFLYASSSPTGEYILAATNEGFALYDSTWLHFGEYLGLFINLGWFTNDVFFVTVMLHSDNYMQENGESYGSVGYFCHFFNVNDINTQLEIIPFKYKPLCCTIDNSVFIVYDVNDTITGYNIYTSDSGVNFDLGFQESLDPMEYDLVEIYSFGSGFLSLDAIGNLHILNKGTVEHITNGCIGITPSSGRNRTGKEYFCHISPDETYYLSETHRCKFSAKLDNVVSISGGIVVSLRNSVDGKNTFRGIKFVENIISEHLTHFGLNGISQIEPLNIYALDQFVSSKMYHSDSFSDTDFQNSISNVPSSVKSQLFAILVRKEHQKEAVIKLESLFGTSSQEVFEELVRTKQFHVASLMLLPLQLLTDPVSVRRIYCLKIIKGLMRRVAESQVRDGSDVALLNSLIRFQKMISDDSMGIVQDDTETQDTPRDITYNPHFLDNKNISLAKPVDFEHFEISQLFLNYIREMKLLPIYKLSIILNLDLTAFIEQIKEDVLEIVGWGLCTPYGTCQDSKPLKLSELIVAYSTTLDTLDPVNIGKELGFRAERKGSKKNSFPKMSPGEGINGLFFWVFSRLEIYIPAMAIALASHNFLAVTHLLLKNRDIVNIINHILGDNFCENCQQSHALVKHTINETKTKLN